MFNIQHNNFGNFQLLSSMQNSQFHIYKFFKKYCYKFPSWLLHWNCLKWNIQKKLWQNWLFSEMAWKQASGCLSFARYCVNSFFKLLGTKWIYSNPPLPTFKTNILVMILAFHWYIAWHPAGSRLVCRLQAFVWLYICICEFA